MSYSHKPKQLGNNIQTLMLNADYRPIQVVTWQRAICLWFSDKIDVVEEYMDIDINSVSLSIKCPAVIRLTKYRKNYDRKKVKFSRYNVFLRDQFYCQYCDIQYAIKELTFDHVVPRLRGGKTSWTNIVTACHPCNSKKGSNLPEEIGMLPYKRPTEPNPDDFGKFLLNKHTPDEWKNYLY